MGLLKQKQLGTDDCWRTCIASIVGMRAEDVPHFYGVAGWDTELGEAMAKQWLHDRGFNLLTVHFDGSMSFEQSLEIFAKVTDGLYYIMSGRSKAKGLNHAVICKGSQVVLDPLYGKESVEPFSGPCLDNDRQKRWILEVVVKSPASFAR